MRIPEYEIYERRSLPWVVRWGVRAVVWSLMGLTLLMGWWAKYVFDNVEPFEGLHSGEHWISLEQLSPEARGFVEVRWERPYGDLAWDVVWGKYPFDHLLLLGSRFVYWSSLTEEKSQELVLNCWLNSQTAGSFPLPPRARMELEDLLRCTWGASWYDKVEFHYLVLRPMVRERHLSQFRSEEILFKFYNSTPPYLVPDYDRQELVESLLRHCR